MGQPAWWSPSPARPFVVMGFTVTSGKIVAINAIGDAERVRRVAAAVLSDS